jgi:hypothetical protein
MHFDIEKMAAMDRYELLLGTVVPRRLNKSPTAI